MKVTSHSALVNFLEVRRVTPQLLAQKSHHRANLKEVKIPHEALKPSYSPGRFGDKLHRLFIHLFSS